jgi:hypothetical protein
MLVSAAWAWRLGCALEKATEPRAACRNVVWAQGAAIIATGPPDAQRSRRALGTYQNYVAQGTEWWTRCSVRGTYDTHCTCAPAPALMLEEWSSARTMQRDVRRVTPAPSRLHRHACAAHRVSLSLFLSLSLAVSLSLSLSLSLSSPLSRPLSACTGGSAASPVDRLDAATCLHPNPQLSLSGGQQSQPRLLLKSQHCWA